ncbi:MAG: tripartite tricarboxylate transporter TctB family protein [Alphaproteobacteria bacterium]
MAASPENKSAIYFFLHKTNFNTIAAIFFVVISMTLFVIIPGQIEEPLIVLPQSEKNLQATLFPHLVATGFLGLGIWFFFKSFSLTETNKLRALDRGALANVAVTLVAMAIYGPVMINLGFVVSSVIVIAFLATFYGNRNYYLTAAVSVAVPVAIFFTFTKLLATSLPPFPIDTFLTKYFIL